MTAAVTILGSGVALGVYVPALLVDRQLARRGVAAETLVVESLYSAEGLEMLERCRVAYQRQFALALLAHRMLRDLAPAFDENRVERLIERWRAEDRRRFLVWSGLWLPVLHRYRAAARGPLQIDLCRIDAQVSATFRVHQQLCDAMAAESRDVWLWNLERKALDWAVPVTGRAPVRWEDRAERLVTHGGGWGLGTYRERLPELESHGLALDVVVRDRSEADGGGGSTRYFMVDPEWRAWEEESCRFPPFGALGGANGFRRRGEHHEIFDLIGAARAIVSKPGGGTLIDSLEEMSLARVIADLREVVAGAFANPDLPLEVALQALRRTVFPTQLTFLFQNVPAARLRLGGVDCPQSSLPHPTADYALMLYLTESPEGIHCEWYGQPRIILPAWLVRLAELYESALREWLAAPDAACAPIACDAGLRRALRGILRVKKRRGALRAAL